VHGETFNADEQAILAPYVTNLDRPVFALQHLPEEVIAVLFAYYSRSRDSLRRNLLNLITAGDLDLLDQPPTATTDMSEFTHAQDKARQFHEKWVVGYGHASVAEHAVAHLAIENVSIVASKVIEDMRLASYTEKSTRYVEFDTTHYYSLPELHHTEAAALYHDTVKMLFRTYKTLLPRLIAAIKQDLPCSPKQTERGHHNACRAKALDLLRYLLPAGTLTNLLTKMLSHPLPEVQHVGALIKTEAQRIIPTLLKYANRNHYRAETDDAMRAMVADLTAPENLQDDPAVRLVHAPEDAETLLVAAILYGYSHHSWPHILTYVRTLSDERRAQVIDEYLCRRGPHDAPLRALEHLTYTFEVLVDYGAYRDIHRHRMATQTRQLPSPQHGYSTPEDIIRYGIQDEFDAGMTQAAAAYEQLAREQPHLAPYILPLAYRCRVLITWNLRAMHHFVQLRSAKQGHTSYRRIAQDIYRTLAQHHPLLARYMRVDLADYALARS
jgi:thymidylate synthase ThyX